MELKAEIKNYTEQQRMDFIVENNHKLGYEIRYKEETEEITIENLIIDKETGEEQSGSEPATKIVKVIQAWGADSTELLEVAKKNKNIENDLKANEFLEKTFVIEVGADKTPCEFIYNSKTEGNLNSSALGFITEKYQTKEWTDEQGNTVQITAEDVANILLTFNEFANNVWSQWGEYKKAIKNAKNIKELNKIKIKYQEGN